MDESLKSRPSVKEKVMGMLTKQQPPREQPPQEQPPRHYEPGLEVAHHTPWNRNDASLPEVVPQGGHLDSKTTTLPQVAEVPWSWEQQQQQQHYQKKHASLEPTAGFHPQSPAITTWSIPGRSTMYADSTFFAGSQAGEHYPTGHHNLPPTGAETEPRGRRVCGMRRKVFYVVMAVVLVLAVAGLAAGLGAGLAYSRHGDDSSSSSGSSNETATSPTGTPLGTPTETPTGSSTAPPVASPTGGVESTKTARIVCPQSDKSTYAAQDAPERRFRVLCGLDYNSAGGAADLGSRNTTTMAGCIDLCASQKGCVGAGWGDYYGNHVCWMKSRLGESNVSGNWYFAVEVNST